METKDTNYLFLVVTFLTVTAVTTAITAQEKIVQQFNQMNIESAPTFLIFLNSEYKLCLGTLIHEQWALTAAHCFLPFLEARIATSNKVFLDEKHKNLRPLLTVQHPNFTWDSSEHDLMLIKLPHPLNLNIVKLVGLPNATDDRRGGVCTVSGWGWELEHFYTEPDIQINQTVFWFLDEYCQESPLRKIPVQVTENMFCAGSTLEDTHSCQEVAAAPILCQNQLHGILSWTDGCILRGDIGFYTKVSRYTDWILRVIHTS
ncbi:serine protease 58-like [Molossus molossus]|uniref:serine protease 58-like n=1 Tax=Molossus molossus TaxID=27622 RepID=UPI001747051C|nr:serine protease 58-like [Molossus molossus]